MKKIYSPTKTYLYNVDVFKFFHCTRRWDNVNNPDNLINQWHIMTWMRLTDTQYDGTYIFVRKLFHEFNFSQYSLGVNRIFECSRYFFNSNLLACFFVQSRDHNSVSPMTNRPNQRVSRLDLQWNEIVQGSILSARWNKIIRTSNCCPEALNVWYDIIGAWNVNT